MSSSRSDSGLPPRTCPRCGHRNSGWLLVCTRCSAALPEEREDAPTPPETEAAGQTPAQEATPGVDASPPEPREPVEGWRGADPTTVPCVQCGGPIDPYDRFCPRCGAERPAGAGRRSTAPVWAFTGITLLALAVLFLGAFLWSRQQQEQAAPGPKVLPIPGGGVVAAAQLSNDEVADLVGDFFALIVERREDEARHLLASNIPEAQQARLLERARAWVQGWTRIERTEVLGRSNAPQAVYLEVSGDGGTVGVGVGVSPQPTPDQVRLAGFARTPHGEAFEPFIAGVRAVQGGEHETAVPLLEGVTQQQPEAEYAWRQLGIAYGNLKQYDKARQACERTLKFDPTNPTYLNDYAWFASLTDTDLQEALKAARQAVQAQPRNAAFLDTLGWVLFKLGNHEQAIESLEQALSVAGPIPPYRAAAAYHLGVIYARQGKRREAMQYLREALQAEPNGEFSEDARQWLQRLSAPTVGA